MPEPLRLLVTRPQGDAEALAAELAALGHVPIVEPLFDVVAVPARLPEGPICGILLTSRNAVDALSGLAGHAGLTGTPAYCVGAATAAAARKAGFTDVREAGGDAAALTRAVVASPPGTAGTLLHLRGRHGAGDLAEALARAGLAVAEIVLYEAVARPQLSADTQNALCDGTLDGVLLFSPRAASVFCARLREAGLAEAAAGLVAYCLSPAVAAALDIDGIEAHIAAAPRRSAILKLLT